MRTWVDEGAVNDGTNVGLMRCDQTEQLMQMSRVTIVTTISCHVLYFQGPFPLRILVPWVCGHKGPVVESLWGEVIGPERKGETQRSLSFFCCWLKAQSVCVCVCCFFYLHHLACLWEFVCTSKKWSSTNKQTYTYCVCLGVWKTHRQREIYIRARLLLMC